MLSAYEFADRKLVRQTGAAALSKAVWIDLMQPSPEEVMQAGAFGFEVPTLADMEEIEISNRLFHDGAAEYMTMVLPGLDGNGHQIAGPVCFLLTPERLITVRHHAPRPFETYPDRADKNALGCASPERVFLSLVEEVIGRLADHMESIGHGLDDVARQIYQPDPRLQRPMGLRAALGRLGGEGERLSRVRLAMMTIDRALSHFGHRIEERAEHPALTAFMKGQMRDIDSLEDHADFLASRLSLASDATLGMINLAQNGAARIVSVLAVLFVPPTLIASIYGMNFAMMPELAQPWGYPMALGLMLGSALCTWGFFHWRGWL